MNTRTSTVRRGFCALGAAATLGLALAGPAAARPEPGEPVSPKPIILVHKVDDNAFELFQVGGGILAGLALAGAGRAVASRRDHAGLHPA
jgi:ABC-type sugar transport system substrate-binding protein